MKSHYKIVIPTSADFKSKVEELRAELSEFVGTAPLVSGSDINIILPFHAEAKLHKRIAEAMRYCAQFYSHTDLKFNHYLVNGPRKQILLACANPKVIIELRDEISEQLLAIDPAIKFIGNSNYQPLIPLLADTPAGEKFKDVRARYVNKRVEIFTRVKSIVVYQRMNNAWQQIEEAHMKSGRFFCDIHSINGETYTFIVEPRHDEHLNELFYSVSYRDTHFVMRYDVHEFRFKIQTHLPDSEEEQRPDFLPEDIWALREDLSEALEQISME